MVPTLSPPTDKTLSKIVVRLFDKVSNGTFFKFDDPLKERSRKFIPNLGDS